MTEGAPKTGTFLARRAAERRRCARIRRYYWAAGTVIVLLVGGFLLFGPAAYPKPDYAWVQMLPDGGRMVRTIVSNANKCPAFSIDGVPADMDKRRAPVHAAFPVLICEREVSAESDVRVGTDRMPTRPAHPATMVVVGDTGCRIAHFPPLQSCKEVTAWPFRLIAERAAAVLAADAPNAMIIHVGDFNYRDKPCPDANQGCSGTSWGDNWETWRAEFFEPARSLLLAAPWVILRGNHENCARAGAGWQFFFGLPVEKLDGVCKDDGEPYVLNIGGTAARPHVLLVLDTANAGDTYKPTMKAHCETYPAWLAARVPPNADVWLALHQPLWLFGSREEAPGVVTETSDQLPCYPGSTTDAVDAIRGLMTDSARVNERAKISAVFSGDTHLFQMFLPDEAAAKQLPLQIIAGDGGTALDKLDGAPDGQVRIDKAVKSYGVPGKVTAIRQFGFVVLRDNADHWTATLDDVEGQQIVACDIAGSAGTAADPAGACALP